jgi:hypothetical protein
MFGALLWIVYGLVVHARPVVAANVLVLAAAAATTWNTKDTEAGKGHQG